MPETIYRFDLDKTYLKTDFETLKGLLRAALEKPEEKESYPGADILLREIQKNPDNKIFFISGSPEQMRRKLKQKLRLDGIKWEQLVLKPNLRNLLLGRFHALREQVSYKLPVLLQNRSKIKSGIAEILFGDDVESDAYIYSLYADILAGKVKFEIVKQILEFARADLGSLKSINASLEKIEFTDCVIKIFIHLDKKSPVKPLGVYGKRVVPFYNYFQSAVVLCNDGFIGIGSVLMVLNELLVRGYEFRMIANSFQDLVRRKLLSLNDALKILELIVEYSEKMKLYMYGKFYEDMKALVNLISDSDIAEDSSEEKDVLDYVKLYLIEHKKEKQRRKSFINKLLDSWDNNYNRG